MAMRSIKISELQAEMLANFIEDEFLSYATKHRDYNNFSYISEMIELHKKLLSNNKKGSKDSGKKPVSKKEEGDIHEQTLEEGKPEQKTEIEWIR